MTYVHRERYRFRPSGDKTKEMVLPDVVVVGAGLFGTSIAYALARDHASVVLVDQGGVCGGDSRVCFGMVRCHYSNEVTARLAMRGAEIIRSWDEEVGEGTSRWTRTGYLLTATERDVDALRSNVVRLRGCGLETSLLELEEIHAIEPLLCLDGIAAGAWEPDGGFADPISMTLSWFAGAVSHGARVVLGCAVERLLVERGSVRGVVTSGGTIRAGVVVIATGAWSPPLLEQAGMHIPFELRRVQVAMVRQPAQRPQLGTMFADEASRLVMRPDRAGRALAVAYQPPELIGRRDDCPAGIDPSYEDAVRAALRERVPGYADAAWEGGHAGTYDGTGDWNPSSAMPRLSAASMSPLAQATGSSLLPPSVRRSPMRSSVARHASISRRCVRIASSAASCSRWRTGRPPAPVRSARRHARIESTARYCPASTAGSTSSSDSAGGS
jgi:glycine/D-amino acid oxidase-like deaminating enzyme